MSPIGLTRARNPSAKRKPDYGNRPDSISRGIARPVCARLAKSRSDWHMAGLARTFRDSCTHNEFPYRESRLTRARKGNPIMLVRTIVYYVADYRIVSLYDGYRPPTFKILATDCYIGKASDGGYKTKVAAIRAARRFAEPANRIANRV